MKNGGIKMLEGIEVLCHSSIRINKEKVIYIDPFRIDKNYNDADLIFITHDHYDHYSEEDIDKVKKQDTVIVAPEELLTKLLRKGFRQDNIITVEPYDVDMEDRKSTRLNSSHSGQSRMPSSA